MICVGGDLPSVSADVLEAWMHISVASLELAILRWMHHCESQLALDNTACISSAGSKGFAADRFLIMAAYPEVRVVSHEFRNSDVVPP